MGVFSLQIDLIKMEQNEGDFEYWILSGDKNHMYEYACVRESVIFGNWI